MFIERLYANETAIFILMLLVVSIFYFTEKFLKPFLWNIYLKRERKREWFSLVASDYYYFNRKNMIKRMMEEEK